MISDNSMTILRCCTKCGEHKPVDDFSKAKTGLHGRRGDCRTCRRAYNRDWYHSLDQDAKRARGSTAKHKAYMKDYVLRNEDRLRIGKKAWFERNKDAHRASTRNAMRRRRATAKGKLESNVARALHRALKDKKNGAPSFELLKFSVEELMIHLEKQFVDGMNWENYGKWHVDHVNPLAKFNYETPADADFGHAWALTNLRPLWAADNIRKGAKRVLLV